METNQAKENQKKTTIAEDLISEGRLKACETDIPRRLQEVGFLNAAKLAKAKPYPEISEERICDFVKKKAGSEIEKLNNRPYSDALVCIRDGKDYGIADLIEVFVEGRKFRGTLQWREVLIEKYNAIPPEFVLEKLAEAKKSLCFDYYTVATIEFKAKTKPDPLLLGRIKDNRTRYFIAQWDNDLRLDDI